MKLRNLLILLAYTLLACLLTAPLLSQFGDHIIGTDTWAHDEYSFVWSQWWVKHALFDLGVSPLSTRIIFYPLGVNLASFTILWTHAVLGLPIQFAFGLVPAVNVSLLFSFVVGAFGMFLLARYLLLLTVTPSPPAPAPPEASQSLPARRGLRGVTESAPGGLLTAAAFVAGIAYAFTSSRWVYAALGHDNVLSTEWFPFFVLFLIKTLRNKGWKNPVLTGLFAALTLYSDSGHGPLLILFSALLLIYEWRLLRNAAVWARLVAAGAAAGLFFAPVLIPEVRELAFSGYSLPGFGHGDSLLVDLFGFLTPTSLSPFNRNWTQELDLVRQGISRFSDVNTFFVGYATVLLALLGAVLYFKRVRIWIATAFVFAVLSLGPLLHINGVSQFDLDGLAVTFPMPYLLLHYIPLLRENRVPNRYSILVVLALAILIAYGTYWLIARISAALRGRRLNSSAAGAAIPLPVVALSALLIAEHLATPLPLSDARVPEAYSQIAREPGDFSILTLPLGWRNSFGQLGAEDTRIQSYQALGGKFLLGGNTSRNAPFLFDYFQRAPILSSIIALETYQNIDDETQARDRAAAADFINFFDLRYLVVSPAVPNRLPYSDTRDRTLEYLQKVLPLGDKTYDDGKGTLVYKVNQTPLSLPLRVGFGEGSSLLYRGDGWAGDEQIGGAPGDWSTAQNARVFVPLREVSNSAVTVRALPFDYPGHTQTLSLTVNGRPSGAATMKPGWNEYRFAVSASLLHPGVNELTWQFSYLVTPRDAIPPNWSIGSTGVASPVDILVQSTSQFGSIKAGGKEVSPLKRGYNLAVVDPKTGQVTATKSFDLGGSTKSESGSMAAFLGSIPKNMIIAGAVQEDASAVLGVRAVDQLKALGLAADLRGKPGYTHAFIAVSGHTGPLESSGEGGSMVSVGHNPDNRLLGVAFSWLDFGRDSQAAINP